MAIETGTPPVALPRASDRGETLTVRDDRTGRTYVIPIQDGAIRATELNKIRTASDDPGLLTYDPGFMATAAVKSETSAVKPSTFRLIPISAARGMLSALMLISNGTPPRASNNPSVPPIKLNSTLSTII